MVAKLVVERYRRRANKICAKPLGPPAKLVPLDSDLRLLGEPLDGALLPHHAEEPVKGGQALVDEDVDVVGLVSCHGYDVLWCLFVHGKRILYSMAWRMGFRALSLLPFTWERRTRENISSCHHRVTISLGTGTKVGPLGGIGKEHGLQRGTRCLTGRVMVVDGVFWMKEGLVGRKV